MKIKHEISQSSPGILTVAALTELAEALAAAAKADAWVRIASTDSQRDGAYTTVRVTWEDDPVADD